MPQESHWTEKSAEDFAHRLAFDFVAQVEDRLDRLPMKQSELAHKLGVSEGAVSKLLNNPQNLTIRTIANYARALGMKASIVAYDDGDTANLNGPINPGVFSACWEKFGKPRDLLAFQELPFQTATTHYNVAIFFDVKVMFAHSDAFGGLQLQKAQALPVWSLPFSFQNMYQISAALPSRNLSEGLNA